MKVLVTGVAGFIGSNLAEALLAKGYDVVGMDNMSQGDPLNIEPFIEHPHFEMHIADIRQKAEVEKAARGCEAIVLSSVSCGNYPEITAIIWSCDYHPSWF